MAIYELALLFVGLAIFGAVVLPRLVSDKPLSFPLLYLVSGFVLFSLPIGVSFPDPVQHAETTKRLTELVVIISLMGVGLKIDRPFSLHSWGTTWRLLGIVMPLTIAATALLSWGVLGTLVATSVLLGAVVAPTDPVLASDVQASPPTAELDENIAPEDQEETVRFGLTSEAGLNDGLAFPFTYLAIALAAASLGGSAPLGVLGEWFLVDVLYRIAVGTVLGYAAGRFFGWVIFKVAATNDLAKIMAGAEALAVTLVTYAATELVHGYGFIAVFVAAMEMRHYEWGHDYHVTLHDFAVMIERLLMAAVLLLFGGAIAGGLLAPLTWTGAAVAAAVVFLVRPAAGLVGFIGSSVPWAERLVISTFGIRGLGSFFYLAFALNEASFAQIQLLAAADELWAFTGFVVLLSVVVHGASANYVVDLLELRQEGRQDEPAGAPTD